MAYDLDALCARQKELDERKAALLAQWEAVRTGMVEEFDSFAHEADDKGLHGVRPCEALPDVAGVFQARLTLRGVRLLLVGPRDATYDESLSSSLVARLFIYEDFGLGDKPPFYDVVVREAALLETDPGERSYKVSARRVGDTWSTIMPARDADAAGGRAAAAAIIGDWYAFTPVWGEHPTLQDILGERSGKAVDGFRAAEADKR